MIVRRQPFIAHMGHKSYHTAQSSALWCANRKQMSEKSTEILWKDEDADNSYKPTAGVGRGR